MKLLIQKLLREGFDDISNRTQLWVLYKEGKKFYPKLEIIDPKTNEKYDPQKQSQITLWDDYNKDFKVYTRYPKIKNPYSIGGFQKVLTTDKIGKVLAWVQRLGAKKINHSKTTNSVYFTLNDISFRISDHRNFNQNRFNGHNIHVSWNTTGKEIYNQLKKGLEIQPTTV